MANPNAGNYRLSVVVSKKVSKKAVVRNRIRRRIYEHVRILFGTSPNLPIPYDFLLTVFDERLATLPADELAGEINKLFKKANLTS
jgi:ribonuclease P protein component